jgi:ABC-2 type transport system permease protein
MNTSVLFAVFKRNFVSYFANPTGYLFICAFVLLSSIAAFWPNEFFNANLANLDQLNDNPYLNFFTIMLVFIPAITMGIWSEERRQGTDELLLTIPAGDLDIVLGKYLAAVAIYTVSLLFSLACNYAVLRLLLGDPDAGLFLGTYLGYWLVGLAMLAIGMVGSFLTANLTIAFVLGVLLNAPLVLTGVLSSAAEFVSGFLFGRFVPALALSPESARALNQWSLHAQFQDFSRGVVSFAAAAYFLMIVAVMLYVSMILIGRRHWRGGWQRRGMLLHYTVRTLALAVAAVGVSLILRWHDLRVDATSERVSSLCPQTVTLLQQLKSKLTRPVEIEAFVSPAVPEEYVQTRLNLLGTLREIEARCPKVRVRINDTEPFSEEASRAERGYQITAHRVETHAHGARGADSIFLGVAMTSGLQKVIVPFIDKGIPVEYEVVRSLCTVAEPKRRRVGILGTDAPLYGAMNFQTFTPSPNWPIIDELQKQYEVVRVDASKEITERYDVLLAVQPSTLGPEDMTHFLAAVRNGQPTVIFEDPWPLPLSDVAATSMPRQPPGGMNPFMQPRPLPKGDIQALWDLLGVDFTATEAVWQKYNPYPKVPFQEELVFIDRGGAIREPFNAEDPVSAGLQQVLFLLPGAIGKLNASKLEFTPLIRTGTETGTIAFSDRGPMPALVPTHDEYVLAAHIRGKPRTNPRMAAEKAPAAAAAPVAKPAAPEINVILVADVDVISPAIFQLREQAEIPELGMRIDLDNVNFVLNALDELAGDHRFAAVRSHRPKYRTLTRIVERTQDSTLKAVNQRKKYYEDYEKKVQEEQAKVDETVAEIRRKPDLSSDDVERLNIALESGRRKVEAASDQLARKRDAKVKEIMSDLAMEVRGVENNAKWLAVLLPPILPLMLGAVVFAVRRAREREGVSHKRLR